jgi:diguanylate cyclase (GGDEF)-like protein
LYVPVGPLLALLIVAVVANLGLMAVVVAPTILGRPSPFGGSEHDPESLIPVAELVTNRMADGQLAEMEGTAVDGVPTATYDRVVRIVSLVFILSASTLVAVTGLWPDTEALILGLLAVGGLFVLAIHDVLPTRVLGTARFVAEGSVAITLVTLLVALTGREMSPFFFAFPLIVVGAALVVDPRVTLVLAGAAVVGYLAAIGIRPEGDPISASAIADTGINLSALLLLAYVAMVISREQRRSREAAIRTSTVDSLTGLYNRAFFFAAIEREIQRSARSGRGFCLLMMDLDGLKSINDRYGHFHGDRALRIVGETIRTVVRRIDTAARYGGDEFVAVLPETDPTGAFVAAEKIRRSVSEHVVEGAGFDFRTSLSIGVVAYPRDGTTVDELMIAADKAMYNSKRRGKNRVVGSDVDRGPDDGPHDGPARDGDPGFDVGDGGPERVGVMAGRGGDESI